MNASQSHLFHKEKQKENALVLNTIEILNGEKESILSEVLKCNICLELPVGKQVRICEEGHHFCLTCHNRIDVCGICRGQLLQTRNFVVEQLISRLGAILGISNTLSAIEHPSNLSPGLYKCLHSCPSKMAAHQMLTHLRTTHSAHLMEKVRSNPYSRRFSFICKVNFLEDKKYIFSTHVSDMGLFTIELTFFNLDFFGCVKMLADKTVSSLFRHQLVVKIPNAKMHDFSGSLFEFSISNCPVFSYSDETETIRHKGGGLKIKGVDLLEYTDVGSTLSVFFSVWKNQEFENKSSSLPSVVCLPESHLFFKNDRKIRRNKNRNLRKKKLREKLKNLVITGENSVVLSEGLSRLSL